MTIYDEFIDAAVEIIDEFTPDGPNVTYVVVGNGAVADPNEPWNAGFPTETEVPVRMVFVRDDLEDRQLRMYRDDSEVGEGQVNAYMYPYAAIPTPKLKDKVIVDGETLVVRAVNPIPPKGNKVACYEFEFGT